MTQLSASFWILQLYRESESVSCSVMSDSLRLHGACQAPLSREFSSKNTGVGCHFLLQGILPIQGSNLRHLHCRQSLPSEPPGKASLHRKAQSLQQPLRKYDLYKVLLSSSQSQTGVGGPWNSSLLYPLDKKSFLPIVSASLTSSTLFLSFLSLPFQFLSCSCCLSVHTYTVSWGWTFWYFSFG